LLPGDFGDERDETRYAQLRNEAADRGNRIAKPL
jgi:hypothetical protein